MRTSVLTAIVSAALLTLATGGVGFALGSWSGQSGIVMQIGSRPLTALAYFVGLFVAYLGMFLCLRHLRR